MTPLDDWMPHAIIPAALLPSHADFSIDEPAYRRHLRGVAGVRGIAAMLRLIARRFG